MAWIAKPCGLAEDAGGLEQPSRQGRGEVEGMAEVRCSWRQSLEEPVRSRLAGMWSELNAYVRPSRS